MWRTYLTVGFRALAANKTYAFINIVGLALGLAACLLILLFVRHELSYDAWLPNAERTYQLQSKMVSELDEEKLSQSAAYPAGVALKKDFPQIDKLVHAQFGRPVIIHKGEATDAEGLLFVDGAFFDVLQLPFVKGDPGTALAQVGSLVLTESKAKEYFGTSDPIGQTITFKSGKVSTDHQVTGIIKDLPKNSHLGLKMLTRFDPANPPTALSVPDLTTWNAIAGFTYLTLKPGVTPASIHAGIPAWKKRNVPVEKGGRTKENRNDWRLANVRDIHLGEATGTRPNAERGLIITFAVVAALILLMACINFTNLATARASRRAREVALRKVLGASRKQLMIQFLGESLLLAMIAMLIALALVELLLPGLSAFLEADLTLSSADAGDIILPIIGLVLLVGLAGGLYPAVYLSRFHPAAVLKANSSAAEAPGSGRLRAALVVTQFAISIGLIICTAIVYGQTVFARSIDAGYKRDGLLQVENVGELKEADQSFAREVSRLKGVTSASRTMIGVSTGMTISTMLELPGMARPVELESYAVDPSFFDTMGIKRLAGRTFQGDLAMDDATLPMSFPLPPDPKEAAALARRGINIVINESAAKSLGYPNPAAAVGKTFKGNLLFMAPEPTTATIIGVVQDSRFRSVRDPVAPIIFRYDRSNLPYLVIRYENADPIAIHKQVGAVWKRLAPEIPFEADFADDVVRELYEQEEARGQIFAAFALVAVLIASLGLFGLAAFTADRRTKEIGIRKVLGAKVRDIVRLLTWQFSKPVILANLIAWPIAWWVMRDWLNTFDARIALTPTPFLLAGLIALAIAIGTIAGHAMKVARANPIQALRYE